MRIAAILACTHRSYFRQTEHPASLVVIVIILQLYGVYSWHRLPLDRGDITRLHAIPGCARIYLSADAGFDPLIHDYQAGTYSGVDLSACGTVPENMYQQKILSWQSVPDSFRGKGLLSRDYRISVKDGNWLNTTGERADFIFAIIGRTVGFIGGVTVVLCSDVIVFECLRLAYKSREHGGAADACTGMAALIGFRALPARCSDTQNFPQYRPAASVYQLGVSSLISIFIGMGLVLNVGLQHKVVVLRRYIVMNIGLVAHMIQRKTDGNFCIAYRGIL